MRFSGGNAAAQGVVRQGAGLLQGMVVCGKCGHHMQTIYKPRPKYVCQSLSRRFGKAACAFLNGPEIDEVVVQAFFEALQPAQLDVLEMVVKDQAVEQSRLTQQWQEQLKRSQYEANLAARQYHAVDPDNRLVAAELERRWEGKLQQRVETEQAYAQFEQTLPSRSIPSDLAQQFRHISKTLPALWDQLPAAQKKELLRSLIKSVILHRQTRDKLEVKIVWVSGFYSVLHMRLATAGNAAVPGYKQLMGRLQELWLQGKTDAEIATQLTGAGFHSARSAGLSAATIKGLRLGAGWYREPQRVTDAPAGYMKVSELALELEVSGQWIYRRIHNGQIDPQYVLRHPKSNAILIQNDRGLLDTLRELI